MGKKMGVVLRISFKEYVETWGNLIHTFYQEGMSDEELFRDLAMTQEGEVRFSLELATILSLIAVMSFASKPKLCTTEKHVDILLDRIVEDVYQRILPDADAETLKGCKAYFDGKRTIFSQICKNIYSTNPTKRQPELVGFARYLVAQVSSKEEASNVVALQWLGILLSSASDAYMTLLGNTTQDTIQIDGKPSFSVKKDR